MMTEDVQNIPVVNPELPELLVIQTEGLKSLIVRAVLPFFDEIRQPDCRELDNIIFDALGLTGGERDAVYEAVIELVRQRLEKAKSR